MESKQKIVLSSEEHLVKNTVSQTQEEILPIGISFQSEIPEDRLEGIFNILRLSRFNPILINSLQDFENFQNGEEENL